VTDADDEAKVSHEAFIMMMVVIADVVRRRVSVKDGIYDWMFVEVL